jgi:hypothetical protein
MKKQIQKITLAIFLCSSLIIHAQNQWKLCPLPVTAHVRDIVFSAPGIIVIGTSEGVYWSDDLGDSWKSGNGNLPNRNIHAIVALAQPHLIAATDDGIYITSDLGKTWRAAKDQFFAKHIHELEEDYELAAYAATDDGVWASNDYGDTWMPFGLQSIDLLSIAIGVNGEMLAGASRNGDDGIYRTKDFGITWKKVFEATLNVNTLEIAPHGYFAGTHSHHPFNKNVWRSDWSGTPWQESGLINCSVSSFTFGVVPDMFAGIDQKAFWPDTTTSYGVQHSPDAGKTWKPINEGLTNTDVHSLFMFWENLFAGTTTGIYKYIFDPLSKVNDTHAKDEITHIWNSATNMHSIKSEKNIPILHWKLYDTYGREILNGTKKNFTEFQLPVQDCTSGIYFLNVKTESFNKSFQWLLAGF